MELFDKGVITRYDFPSDFSFNTLSTKIVSFEYESQIKNSFQNRLASYYHPTVGWESYRENGEQRVNFQNKNR